MQRYLVQSEQAYAWITEINGGMFNRPTHTKGLHFYYPSHLMAKSGQLIGIQKSHSACAC